MQNAIARMIKKISRLPLFNRLRYKFSGYKTQVFFDSVCKKAPKYILVISIVLIIGYMFLHPLDKIKLNYFLTRDCTITVVNINRYDNGVSSGYFEDRSEIIIDNGWIKYKENYYDLNGETVYCYSKDISGKWQKSKHSGDIFPQSFYILLDKNNYIRDKKNPFVWVLKEDVYEDIPSFYEIKVTRAYGSIAINGNKSTDVYKREVYICFGQFGITKITFPWDD
ncbi:MAG: hypothetical protein IKJ13_05390 [Clostridia bacterium]|nr:hypothetical protein [Clostridia bacterium]